MPALDNPRREAFAQAIFKGLGNGTTQAQAYKAVGYKTSPGRSTISAASRLLLIIVDRVKELQSEALERELPAVDASRARIGKRLDLASRMAQQQRNPQGIVSSELGLAKVYGLTGEVQEQKQGFAQATSMKDIGKRLLQSIGLNEPDDAAISEAIEANDAFVQRLESIKDKAQRTLVLT